MDTGRSRNAILAVLALLLVAGVGLHARAEEGAEDTVLILHTNDVHSHLVPAADGTGGLARIGGYVAKRRAERPDVLYLDAGDAVAGTPVSSIFKGRPVFQVMNVTGVDAFAIGNHEFDYGWRLIEEYRRIASFPILCANATGPKDAVLADAPYRVLDADGVRVAVIGVVTPGTPEITAGGATDGVTFRPAAEAIRPLLPELAKKSDLVVVLSHLGLEGDRALAAAVPEIDVIVGGHSHTVLEKPLTEGRTVIVQAGSYGKYVGALDLTVDLESGTVKQSRGSLVPVDAKLPASSKVSAAVEVWEAKVREKVDLKIGVAARDLDKRQLKRLIEEVYQRALETDLGYQNPGGVRAAIGKGDIRVRDVWTVLPFENTLVTVRVKGASLPEWLARRIPKVEPEHVYTVATNSFVTSHLDRYFPNGIEGMKDSGKSMRDTVIEHVKATGSLE
ncbi:MAG: bifunctional metallophosphatase/5'-nucleotidase [Planctomycetota bacterium]|jgi:2',3'-cyclic-nucleotide 2'-phosphodiesterase (5'-nucleotidase family)